MESRTSGGTTNRDLRGVGEAIARAGSQLRARWPQTHFVTLTPVPEARPRRVMRPEGRVVFRRKGADRRVTWESGKSVEDTTKPARPFVGTAAA